MYDGVTTFWIEPLHASECSSGNCQTSQIRHNDIAADMSAVRLTWVDFVTGYMIIVAG